MHPCSTEKKSCGSDELKCKSGTTISAGDEHSTKSYGSMIITIALGK